jgi:hypothetical protein
VSAARTPAADLKRVEKIQRPCAWFHDLHPPDGIQTAPDHPFSDFPA